MKQLSITMATTMAAAVLLAAGCGTTGTAGPSSL